MIKRDYYLILGVSRDESTSDIRKAFRRLVKKFHPDLAGPKWIRQFQEIVEAYKTLSDPDRREYYDRGLSQTKETRKMESERIIMGFEREIEPLVPDTVSVMSDFSTVRPSVQSLLNRFLKNFLAVEIPKADRPEGLTIDLILTPYEALKGGRVP